MKIPLIADASHKTVNKQTGVQNVIIWSRGDKLVVKSPRQHGYYLEGGDTERQVLGKTKKKNYKFYHVENIGELSVEKISPNAIFPIVSGRCILVDSILANDAVVVELPLIFP